MRNISTKNANVMLKKLMQAESLLNLVATNNKAKAPLNDTHMDNVFWTIIDLVTETRQLIEQTPYMED